MKDEHDNLRKKTAGIVYEGQYDSKNVEHISIENIEVVSNGMDWKSRHLEAEKRKAEIRDRIHKQTEQGQKSAKDYFRPAKPTPSIYDSDLKRVAVYARVSTSSEEQISSIENQTLYYTKKIAETENWNLQDIYSDEGKSGTSLRKRDAFKRMSVVTICLGDPGTENYTGIVKFMDVLLSSSRAATEKKKILEEEFGVAMNEDLEREVLVMCNLSQGVKAEGREEGISIGEMRMLVQLVRDGDLKMERAAEKAKMTVEQFKKVMENTPLQAV